MDSKAILANKRKINELAIQHNKLTTLVGCLLNEINGLKKELRDARNGNMTSSKVDNTKSQQTNNQHNQQQRFNFNELRAEDILKQLSINDISIDN